MKRILAITACFVALASPELAAQQSNPPGIRPTDADSARLAAARGYSPYAGRGYPTQVFWGDTHVHTDNSLDAKGFGASRSTWRRRSVRARRGDRLVEWRAR